MWRRVSAQLQTLTPWRSSVVRRSNGADSLRNRASASAPSSLHSSSPASSPFQKTAPLFSHQATSDAENITSKGKRKVEDIMPIATGHEREELEAELEGRKRFDMDPPVGPFGTKDFDVVLLARTIEDAAEVKFDNLRERRATFGTFHVILLKGSLGATVELLPCDLEVTDLRRGNSLLQKCKEAPAIVQSYYDKRIVGCPGGEGEDEHDVVWFWLEKGKPHECPVCSQYFMLEVIGEGGPPDGHGDDDH